MDALQQALPDIRAAGGSLVAISPEKPDFALMTQEKLKLDFEVLSDLGNQVARGFGLVFQVPAKLAEMYRGFGIDLAKFNADRSGELPVPGTFVLDREGVIRYRFVSADYTQRSEPADVVDALRALRLAGSETGKGGK
ncbi:MAG: AhpC/TSA family protein [Candidatus Wallbacteria bacterium]|nr:AhpC/TSA family protein [Candidatus Wallbacteria bacterium]